jgi:hypothetical protein
LGSNHHSVTSDEKELIDKIRAAFAGVKLDDGMSLNMTEYYDSGGCLPEFEEKARGDERDDWQKIADKTLEEFLVTFPFTDLKGYRFYIPAYMIWAIRNHKLSDSIIGDFTVYAIDPCCHQFDTIPFLEWFTADQIECMVTFLEYVVRMDADMDAQVANKNLIKIREAQQAVAHQRAISPAITFPPPSQPRPWADI